MNNTDMGLWRRDTVGLFFQSRLRGALDVGWREELPDPVEVPLEEVSAAISELDGILHSAAVTGRSEVAASLDAVVGRMTRWLWPLLGELDEDYDG